MIGIDPRTGVTGIPDIRYMFENAFVWSTIAVLCFYVSAKINLWFGLFLALASFSAWFPINSNHSEKAHMMVLYGVIWYSVCVHFLNTEKDRNTILNIFCVVALANVLMLFLQGFINYDPIHSTVPPAWGLDSDWDRVPNVGLMDCQNSASALLAISAPAFFRKKWVWCLIPLGIGFVLAKTFAGPMAVSIAAVVFGIIHYKKVRIWILLICSVFLFGYYTFVDKPDTSWRLKTWKIGADLYKQHWIFGSGIGHWKDVFGSKQMSKAITNYTGKQMEIMAQAHNEPLQAIFEMGIGAAIIMAGYLFSVFRKYKKDALIPMMALLIIIIDSLVFFPFHIALIAMISLTWMALLQGELNAIRQDNLRGVCPRAGA